MSQLPRHPAIAGGILALTLGLGFSACQKVPYTGRSQAVMLSMDQEVALGVDAYTEIMSTETIVGSGDLYQQVKGVASGVSTRTPQPYRDLAWEFKLVASESVNAFALPGGKVGVYTGILPVLSNEAGLGSVLGHEAGHVVARHSAERITGVMMLELGLAAADVGLSNTGLHDQLMAMLGLGAQVGVILPFSRANELEADYLGGIFMAKAGYDPSESWAVWERMTALGGDSPIAIFSTHPSNAKRITRLKEELPTFESHYKKAKTKRGRGDDLRVDLIPTVATEGSSSKSTETDSGKGTTDSGKGTTDTSKTSTDTETKGESTDTGTTTDDSKSDSGKGKKSK